ncbi:MAG: AmmeMemoRadiSam system radical SAM enzyme [Kiritimatiellae bacterium]|nr:AmmeMemoRadiSam system radical SAM enzyme [Kiritimatiellia bacterium]
MKTAQFWHEREPGTVECDLCPHHCVIAEGGAGRCRVRGVRDGKLAALGYGLLSAVHLDPIEKKPLYHFLPGRPILSIGGWGCNLACAFCQNWSISQQGVADSRRYTPEEVAEASGRGGSVGVAYTYNEPLIAYEFVRACAQRVRAAGAVNVLVTNGHIEPEPATQLLGLIDALNIDVKSMEADFYATHCRGRLEPVLRFAKQARAAGCHVEITNLVIPGLNDKDGQIEALARWVRETLGPDTPLHLSAYRPEYKMNIRATPPEMLCEALERCTQHLSYVYLGNVWTADGQNTHCPHCGSTLVRRQGYSTRVSGITAGACSQCGRKADLVLNASAVNREG